MTILTTTIGTTWTGMRFSASWREAPAQPQFLRLQPGINRNAILFGSGEDRRHHIQMPVDRGHGETDLPGREPGRLRESLFDRAGDILFALAPAAGQEPPDIAEQGQMCLAASSTPGACVNSRAVTSRDRSMVSDVRSGGHPSEPDACESPAGPHSAVPS
ncbi:hypothetical protein [Pseudogemmobacter bohemicus]|uniref:hypothetical protein n=1 Tax=Pseudogemmobacter bohemicus TaxID=2250708 RepID=UPI00130050F2|nr:hypothetical protein [Pseudogemmobacter bohemicus]